MARAPCLHANHHKDEGYAWLVLVLSFLCHILQTGFSFGIAGVLTIAHKELFGISVFLSSLIGTTNITVIFLFAPVAATLVKKSGCRITQFIGGIFMITSLALSTLTTEVWHAFLLFGVLEAIGASCTYSACSQILPFYFDKYKYLAFSMVVFGHYIGLTIWPITGQYLFDTYGYSQAMGILSVFHTLHLVAAIVFVSPKHTNSLPRIKSAVSEISLLIESRMIQNKEEQADGVKMQTTLAEDCKILLKSVKIWLLLFNGLLWCANNSVYAILINDYIVENTYLTADQAALGVTITGLTSIVGCLCVVLASSFSFDRVLLHMSAVMIFALSTIIVTFSTGEAFYYILSGTYGIGIGITLANLLTVTSEFCEPEQLTMLFALHLLAEGIGSATAGPITGYVSINTSSQTGLILCGVAGVAGSLCLLPVVILNRRRTAYQP